MAPQENFRQWHQVAWRRFNQCKPESAGQTIQAQIWWGRFPDNYGWLVWELHSRNWGIYPNSTQWIRPLACNQNMWSEAPGSDCLRQSSLNSFRQRKSPNCKSSLHTRMCNSIKIRECCKPGWRVWLWSFHHSVSHHTLSRKIQLQSSTDEEPSEAMPRERTFHNVPHQRTLTHRKQHRYIAAAECQQWTQWSSATPAMNGFMWAPVSQWLLSRWTELQMELYYM